LSQYGIASGEDDVALRAAVSATSTIDAVAHGAWAAVDGNEATYWASRAGAAGDVELVVDFGDARALDTVRIAWELPARSFAVLLSADGGRWDEVFTTAVNVVANTVLDVGGREARKLKVVMRQMLPAVSGVQSFGIRSVVATAPRLRPVLEECAVASKSLDARDKYFLVSAGSHDAAGFQALRAAAPRIEAAEVSLSGAIASLTEVLPKLATCRGSKARPSVQLVASSTSSRSERKAEASPAAAASELLARAREVIVAVRQSLV